MHKISRQRRNLISIQLSRVMRRLVTWIPLLTSFAVACANAQTGTRPLPFDTTGAGRGDPPNHFESTAATKWLGGGTIVHAEVTVFNVMEPAALELRAFGTDPPPGRLVTRALPLGECPFELRLYREPTAAAPVWDSNRARRAL